MSKALLSLVVLFALLAARPARASSEDISGDPEVASGPSLLGIDTSYDPLGREADAVVPLTEEEVLAAAAAKLKRAPASPAAAPPSAPASSSTSAGQVLASQAPASSAAPGVAEPAIEPEE